MRVALITATNEKPLVQGGLDNEQVNDSGGKVKRVSQFAISHAQIREPGSDSIKTPD
jgi:hypothetical protein